MKQLASLKSVSNQSLFPILPKVDFDLVNPFKKKAGLAWVIPLILIFVLFLVTLWFGMIHIGPQVASLGILFVALVSWLYGVKYGLGAAAVNDLFMILVLHHLKFDVDMPVISKVLGSSIPFITAALVGFIHSLYVKLKRTEILLRNEHEKSELLLNNIFPKRIADRLKNGEVLIADRYQESTILFSDLVGFSHLSKTMTPQKLIQLLDKIITHFDQLSEKFQVEKIKTIGDGYLVVSGIPDENKLHASAVCNMALAMLESIETLNKEENLQLQIRIGIHSGPVIGGVIGPKKFTFDLWGDTVNLANRLESHGIPGRIHLSRETHEIIKNDFAVEAREPIEVKGYGLIETYFLRPVV